MINELMLTHCSIQNGKHLPWLRRTTPMRIFDIGDVAGRHHSLNTVTYGRRRWSHRTLPGILKRDHFAPHALAHLYIISISLPPRIAQ